MLEAWLSAVHIPVFCSESWWKNDGIFGVPASTVSILELHANGNMRHIHSRLVYVVLFPISVSHSISFVDEVITGMSLGKIKR